MWTKLFLLCKSNSSSSRGSLTVKIFEELDIDLPSIKEQEKIAKQIRAINTELRKYIK